VGKVLKPQDRIVGGQFRDWPSLYSSVLVLRLLSPYSFFLFPFLLNESNTHKEKFPRQFFLAFDHFSSSVPEEHSTTHH
jgi:hypothetical protein